MNKKPIILLSIDSLMSNPLEVAMQTGRAPALRFLKENGNYYPNVVSSFPTMSVTIDSTLLTGTYADEHKISGLNWFDTTTSEYINYGTGFRETFRIGTRKTVHNMLYRLNHEHLSRNVTTIYEELAKQGKASASINSFVYRGNSPHKLKVPALFQSLTKFKNGKWIAETPPVFSLGAFSTLKPGNLTLQIAAGNYRFITRELKYLIQKNKLPAFTFCIFQDLDLRIHYKGPMDLVGISRIDKQIQKLLNEYSSWEAALEENIWLVIGDNGHAPMHKKRKKALIDLRKVFNKVRIAKINRPVRKKDQLVFSVNQRMAYIYVLDSKLPKTKIATQLKKESRIDVIAWKEGEWIRVEAPGKDDSLHYRPGEEIRDEFGQSWKVRGNLEILDLQFKKNGALMYGDFPDALARLQGALHSQKGRFLVINAKPGYEFKAQSTPTHIGGAAHGSLHKQESHVPLIIAGTAENPLHPRLVDLKEFILRMV